MSSIGSVIGAAKDGLRDIADKSAADKPSDASKGSSNEVFEKVKEAAEELLGKPIDAPKDNSNGGLEKVKEAAEELLGKFSDS